MVHRIRHTPRIHRRMKLKKSSSLTTSNDNQTGLGVSAAGGGDAMGDPDDAPSWAVLEDINHKLVAFALSLGGTATGEHGVGIGKMQFMEQEHGNSLDIMRRIKSLFDPKGILNPGKMF